MEISVKEIMEENPELWKDFEYLESTEVFTSQLPHRTCKSCITFVDVYNVVYACKSIESDENALLSSMKEVLEGLRVAAIAKKLEGVSMGEGRLIVQERMPMSVSPTSNWTTDEDEANFQIWWYGKIDRI